MITQRRFTTLSLATAAVLLATAATADCTRHVYNKSLNVWSYGFHFLSNAEPDETWPIILPGETDTIEYDEGSSDTRMWMIVEQKTNVDGNLDYREAFEVSGCYLRHDGVTGRAVLNDPADGDIIFID